jgi:cytochrome c2
VVVPSDKNSDDRSDRSNETARRLPLAAAITAAARTVVFWMAVRGAVGRQTAARSRGSRESTGADEATSGANPQSGLQQQPRATSLAPVAIASILTVAAAVLSVYIAQYGFLAESGGSDELRIFAGDADRGRSLVVAHGCGACHVIGGVAGAIGKVGPGLDSFADRAYIGGVLPNRPEALVAWLQNPPRYAAGTAMPDVGLTADEARDIAAFLYRRRRE